MYIYIQCINIMTHYLESQLTRKINKMSIQKCRPTLNLLVLGKK